MLLQTKPKYRFKNYPFEDVIQDDFILYKMEEELPFNQLDLIELYSSHRFQLMKVCSTAL